MKYLFLIPFLLAYSFTFSQTPGEWTWMGGDTITNQSGNFGTQGVPSLSNHPPALYEASGWTDLLGNFWLYGGDGNVFSDVLWEFDPTINVWTWVAGKDTTSAVMPVYGSKGVPSATNQPGSRGFGSCSWTDNEGNLWLFGGSSQLGQMNDLWMYSIAASTWVWVSGDSTAYSLGNYGTQGVPSVNNAPQARDESVCTWVDNSDNLWLFGGRSYAPYGFLDDLWKYDISTNEWTWVNGIDTVGALSVYGIKGVSSSVNNPGGRWAYSRWTDKSGNFWLFGGAVGFNGKFKNDLWRYEISTDQWTWISGTSIINSKGFYGSKCNIDSNNIPAARYEAKASWTDACGNFWLMGGWDNSDLWKYNPSLNVWFWQAGDSTLAKKANYGTIGISNPANNPGYRGGPSVWKQGNSNLWLYGGYGFFSDMWRFVPDSSCGGGACNSIIATPTANLSSSDTIICQNDCISFNNLSSNATSWYWSFNGGIPSSSTNQNPSEICYADSGSFDVTLIAVNSGGSDTIKFSHYISVHPAPPTPSISQSNDTLYCTIDPSYTSYQWYIDSTFISGATKSFLFITQSSNYNVQVTNENGCRTAVGINIVLGIQNYVSGNNASESLYPNPVSDQFVLHLTPSFANKLGTISIINFLGQVVKEVGIKLEAEKDIDIKSLPDGVYFVCVKNEVKQWIGKFIKSSNK